MMITNYNIDERVIEKIIAEEVTSQKIDSLLTTYLQQFEPEYTNATHKEHVNLFIRGLLSNLDRKTIEPVALTLKGPSAVRGLQNFFSRSPFNTTGVLNKYQTLVADTIGTENGMISIDESDFVKKGNASPGVARQYCGRLGKTENCQAGVFAAYSSDEDTDYLTAVCIFLKNGSVTILPKEDAKRRSRMIFTFNPKIKWLPA
jgi:SRSO17 transposase